MFYPLILSRSVEKYWKDDVLGDVFANYENINQIKKENSLFWKQDHVGTGKEGWNKKEKKS